MALKKRVPNRPVSRPSVIEPAEEPAKTLPKGVTHEPKAEKPTRPHVQGEAGAGTEASKPIVPAEQPAESGRPREPIASPKAGTERISVEAMRTLTLPERYRLWKKLNEGAETFTPLRKELPKQLAMRLNEAVMRGIVPKVPPSERPKGTVTYYCPYCIDWSVFHTHAWSGYEKCIGCSITVKDFYVQADNDLWKKG